MNFDLYQAGDLAIAVEAGTGRKKMPSLPPGAAWTPVRNGQNLTSLRGHVMAPSDKDAEEQIKKQGYCMAKWPGKRILVKSVP